MNAVRALIIERLQQITVFLGAAGESLFPGKMLRTRLASRFTEAGACQCSQETIVNVCAAIELVHSASLCHDDTIDDALIRRFKPTLWKSHNRSAAILAGDILMCESMELMVCSGYKANLTAFIARVKEVVTTETRQEIEFRNRNLNHAEFLEIARGKTGALFALVSEVCGGADIELRQNLAEAGYLTGTAYQLMDDLIDLSGNENYTGKTLGTDAVRGKQTMPQTDFPEYGLTRKTIVEILTAAVQHLRHNSKSAEGLRSFIIYDIIPIIRHHGLNIKVDL